MIYPINMIAITQYPHKNSKAIDFGWGKKHNQWVLAVDNGIIYKLEKQNLGGNVIYLKHDTGMISVYGHLKEFSVKKGQKVVKGQRIGKMGKSGKGVTGEHLHFEIHSKGSNMYGEADIDPMKFLQVDKNQEVLNTTNNKRLKDKFLYTPDNQLFEVARSYRLLVEKALRKTPELTNNILKVKDIKNKKGLTKPKTPNAEAFYKVGTDVFTTKIIDDHNRVWGKCDNFYVVLQNQDGTKQCEKLRGIN